MIGNEIKKWRHIRGMTQKELCRNICSQSELSKIESLKNDPSGELIRHLAKRLDVEVQVLFFRVE